MKTITPKQIQNDKRSWYLVDAEGQTLGRLATKVADILRGKNKVDFSNHMDNWDYVVIINADKIAVSWNKLEWKIYYRHTMHPGWLRRTKLVDLLEKKPNEPLKKAVSWMLPKNRLRKNMMMRLKLVSWPEHNFKAQNPQTINL